MTKAFINTDIWKDDGMFLLPIEAKVLYFFLISGPDRKYIDVFKLSRRLTAMVMGVTDRQFDVALNALIEAGYVEVYDEYIGIIKSYAVELNGTYNKINSEREYEKLPSDVRKHFYPDGREIEEKVTVKRKQKPGPPAETIKTILDKQPEVLRVALGELVADRKERNKPPTTRAVKGWINKLEKMYPNQLDKRVASIEQTIEKGWMGLFEVRSSNDRYSEQREFM